MSSSGIEALKKSRKLKIIFKVIAKTKRRMLGLTIKKYKSKSENF